MTVRILRPTSDGHVGDTFREMLELWEEAGYCTVEPRSDIPVVWLGDVGHVILCDKIRWIPNFPYRFILFGNTVYNVPNSSPWIFWARRPRILEAAVLSGVNDPSERDIQSIFLGKIENDIQRAGRVAQDWTKSTEIFSMPIGGEYPYTQEEYLSMLNRSKFGLCLPGFGPKCNREVELFALGVVPIITPGVDLTYFRPPQLNVHFIYVESPGQVVERINQISDDEWQWLSRNGQRWWQENCSVKGSFDTTMEVLRVNGISVE